MVRAGLLMVLVACASDPTAQTHTIAFDLDSKLATGATYWDLPYPSDLRLAIGGRTPSDPEVEDELGSAVERIRQACDAHGIVPGIHTHSGQVARKRLAAGFRLVTVSSDLVHLEEAARSHLDAARGAG